MPAHRRPPQPDATPPRPPGDPDGPAALRAFARAVEDEYVPADEVRLEVGLCVHLAPGAEELTDPYRITRFSPDGRPIGHEITIAGLSHPEFDLSPVSRLLVDPCDATRERLRRLVDDAGGLTPIGRTLRFFEVGGLPARKLAPDRPAEAFREGLWAELGEAEFLAGFRPTSRESLRYRLVDVLRGLLADPPGHPTIFDLIADPPAPDAVDLIYWAAGHALDWQGGAAASPGAGWLRAALATYAERWEIPPGGKYPVRVLERSPGWPGPVDGAATGGADRTEGPRPAPPRAD